jgi:hypothetical protein
LQRKVVDSKKFDRRLRFLLKSKVALLPHLAQVLVQLVFHSIQPTLNGCPARALCLDGEIWLHCMCHFFRGTLNKKNLAVPFQDFSYASVGRTIQAPPRI